MKQEVYQETVRLIDSRFRQLLHEIQITTSQPIVIRDPLHPPLILDSEQMVKRLNAERLGGWTIDQIIAEIMTAAGVSSLGEYGDADVLTGAVKLKEGSNIVITRDAGLNALLIASTGGLIIHDNTYHDPDYTSVGHTHEEADIIDLLHNAIKIKGKTVDDTAIGDGKVLVYRVAGDKLQYELAGGGAAAGWDNVVCYPWAGTAVLSADPFLSYTAEVSDASGVYVEVTYFDFDMPAGTVKSVYANLVWAMKVTGAGNGQTKWQVASGSHVAPGTYYDITDEVAEISTSYVDKTRSGIAHKITNFPTTTPFTVRCLVKKGTATSCEAKIKSNTYFRVTYKVS